MILRDYQENAIVSIFEYFTKSNGNPCVALPTGTGKSLIIGGFIQRVLGIWPKQRFLVLTHVKELIEQDAATLYKIWPTAPIGIYSAGLKSKDTIMPVIFGGIGSVIKNVDAFGHRDLVLVDECHLISPNDNTMYQKAIAALKTTNPYLKVIGFSATPYRLGQGMITDGGLFTDVCFDLTSFKEFNKLIADGWICPLVPKRTQTEIDISNVGINNGDFAKGELQKAVNKDSITYAALKETIEQGANRRSWLIFASGVEHAENVAGMLQTFGISAAPVHSKMKPEMRDRVIRNFKNGELRAIVNNNVLTTGFDYPPIDLIVMLRPTISPGLWVQMLGRGTRPCAETGKVNCLVLDFAGNTRRLGPINDPVKPRKKGNGGGEAPVKICENCGVYNHASVRFCVACGYEFHIQTKIVKKADTLELLKSDAPIVEFFKVDKVIYHRHTKDGSPPMIRVDYYSGLRRFSEWVCLEHKGFAAKKARDWFRQRYNAEPPETTDKALEIISLLRVPRKIRVWVNKQYPEVLSYEY